MKILIVNSFDKQGGAARAAYRLHQSLLEQNIDSKMLVRNKTDNDITVFSTSQTRVSKNLNKIKSYLDKIPTKLYKNKTITLFSPSCIGDNKIIEKINSFNPDIVHLHWVNNGFLKFENITKINAPIVWSLHDMWLFTGGCHYDEACNRYQKKCGKCKVLNSQKENDLSRKVFNRKLKRFQQIKNITIVGLSNWIHTCAKNSALLKDLSHINIPNPIDTKVYKPFDKRKARELWNLPLNKKLILFGSMNSTSDPRKGFTELTEAMKKLKKDTTVEFVIFGSSKPQNAPNFRFKTHYLGSLSDTISLVTLYNAVDVMVVPSIQENLSNAIMESLACATPVVGFNIGGNSDLIKHKKTGYLAKPFCTTDLSNGIEWILNNKNYDTICLNARNKVLQKFDSNIVGEQYIKLYQDILNKNILK